MPSTRHLTFVAALVCALFVAQIAFALRNAERGPRGTEAARPAPPAPTPAPAAAPLRVSAADAPPFRAGE